MKNEIRNAVVGFAVACLLTTGALAQDIVSVDGEWRATLDTNGTGQITNLFNQGGNLDNLFETLWYEASNFTGGVSARVENMYSRVSQNIGANSASFSMLRNDGRMDLDILVNMISGPNGGARFSLTWTFNGQGTEGLKGFTYADLDVNASAGGDTAMFDVASQSIVQSDAPVTIYFGGTQNYKSWEIQTFAGLRNALDGGRGQLTNSGGGGSADWTAALSSELVTLDAGDSLTLTFQIGSLVPAPAALALLGMTGPVGFRRRRR